MVQVCSYGGGVQSVAIAVLIAQGKLPKPDYMVIADTGRERLSTWDYLERHVQPMLAEVGLRVEIAPHSLATVDLFSHQDAVLMPMYTTLTPNYVPEAAYPERGVSKLRTFCSSEWKARVIERYLKQTYKLKNYITWLGYSFDGRDASRIKIDRNGQRVPGYYYPLVDTLPLTRSDCEQVILGAGLPLPRKSTCRGCPHQTDAEWLDTKLNHPEDFAAAIQDEQEMQAVDPHVWMHKSVKPIDQVEFNPKDDLEDAQCGLGICFI